MLDSTQSSMPMGRTATLPLDLSDVMAAMPVRHPALPNAPMPQQAAGLIGGGAPMMPQSPMAFPAPGAPAEPPFTVEMQSDGSSVYKSKTDPPVVIGVNPAPKLPKSLQPPQP